MTTYNSWSEVPVPESDGGTHQNSYAKGDILYASAANTLAKLPIGIDGEVLTVNTDVPNWAAAGGGGVEWTLIDTDDLAGVISVEKTTGLGTAYDEYKIIIENLEPAVGYPPGIYLSDDGGSTYSLLFTGTYINTSSAGSHINQTLVQTTWATYNVGTVELTWNNNKLSHWKRLEFATSSNTDSTTRWKSYFVKTINDIDAIKFDAVIGTIVTGDVYYYGR